jgi:hypothetical protein
MGGIFRGKDLPVFGLLKDTFEGFTGAAAIDPSITINTSSIPAQPSRAASSARLTLLKSYVQI